MLLSAVSVLVVAQSSSEIPKGLMNNPVFGFDRCVHSARGKYMVIAQSTFSSPALQFKGLPWNLLATNEGKKN